MDMGSRIGALKVAAGRLGLTFDEYQAKIAAGLKCCQKCRQWKPIEHFGDDATRGSGKDSKCLMCRRKRDYGIPTRLPEQDPKLNARDVVNSAVWNGRMPSPKTLQCANCGDQAREYHHHAGYSREHWFDVTPLCTRCHKAAHR